MIAAPDSNTNPKKPRGIRCSFLRGMTRIGQGVSRLLPSAIFGALGVVVGCLFVWGYTVDDAWISLRYARHLANGAGYRFNALGPSTDGVTPLPWPFLLAPFARYEPSRALLFAKALGVAFTIVAGVRSAREIFAMPTLRRELKVLYALLPGLSLPVAAYAVSGMETPVAVVLVVWAVTSLSAPMRVAAFSGVASLFRPELVPFAITLSLGSVFLKEKRTPTAFLSAFLLSVLPFALASVVRAVAFGSVTPLSLLAKPSDALHGALYVAGGLALVGMTPLVFAPLQLWREKGTPLVIVGACIMHVLALVVVGGDWMAFARLFAPLAFPLAIAGAGLASRGPKSGAVRGVASLLLTTFVLLRVGTTGRDVTRDRERLIASVTPLLADAKVIAALDIGWVSAATEANIVDLAGLTDPQIAALPGGHTSKRVDVAMLLGRNVDTVLLYGSREPGGGALRRVVEARLSRSELFASHYQQRAFLPLGESGAGYALFRRVE